MIGAIGNLAGLAGGLAGATPSGGNTGFPNTQATGGTVESKNDIAPEGIDGGGGTRGITLNFTGKGSANQKAGDKEETKGFSQAHIILALAGLAVAVLIFKLTR